MTNLLNEIEARRTGRARGLLLKQHVLESRCFDLSLSYLVDFEPIHTSTVNCIDVDKSGRYMLSGGKDGGIYIHDQYNFTGSPSYSCRVVEGMKPHTVELPLPPQSIETVQWFPFDTGMFVTSGMDQSVRVWDANTMTAVDQYQFNGKIYQHHMCTIPSVNIPLIAVASTVNHVLLVDIKSGQSTHELRGHTSSVMCCAWSPTTDHLLATGSCDSTLRLWDTRSARSCLASFDLQNRSAADSAIAHNGFVNGVAFTSSGRMLLSTGTDEQIRCWDLYTQRNREIDFEKVPLQKNKSLSLKTYGIDYFDICFIPSENSIIIFNVNTGEKINTLNGHFGFTNCCYFQKDRMELYSGGQDRNILLWTKEIKESDEPSVTTIMIERGRLRLSIDDQQGDESDWSDSSSSS